MCSVSSLLIVTLLCSVEPAVDSNQPQDIEGKDIRQAQSYQQTDDLQAYPQDPAPLLGSDQDSPVDQIGPNNSNNGRPTQAEQESISIARQDLRAQQSMAKMARWMFAVAAIQTPIGLLTLYFLWGTLTSTARAAAAAENSAKAAQEAISCERAYMGIAQIRDTHRNPSGFYFSVLWKNYGRTPAILKRFCAECKRGDSTNAIPSFSDRTPETLGNMKLGPGQEYPCITDFIEVDVIEDILKDRGTAYVQSRLEYVDISNPKIQWEEATFKITRNRDWDYYLVCMNRGRYENTGCFNESPVIWKSSSSRDYAKRDNA